MLFSGQYSSYSCLFISFGENEKDISLLLSPCISKDNPAVSSQGYGTSFHHCQLDPVPSWRLKREARQPTSRPARSPAGPMEAVDISCPCSSILLPIGTIFNTFHVGSGVCVCVFQCGGAGAGRDAPAPGTCESARLPAKGPIQPRVLLPPTRPQVPNAAVTLCGVPLIYLIVPYPVS